MLLKGILFGVVISIVSLAVYVRWLMKLAGPGSGQMAIDIRIFQQFFTYFFGGVTIGMGIVTALILGAGYALLAYARHMAGS